MFLFFGGVVMMLNFFLFLMSYLFVDVVFVRLTIYGKFVCEWYDDCVLNLDNIFVILS